jgi:hypothetical protein
MRTRPLLAGLLVLALAGCSGGAGQSPSLRPSPEPTPIPATPADGSPTGEAFVLDVGVHWDGVACSYVGPTVITDGTTTRVEYTFDEGTDAPLLFIGGVVPGTSWDEVLEYVATHRASVAPGWVILTGYANIPPGTSSLYTISTEVAGRPVGGYFVGCATAPIVDGGTDVMYPAALLLVAGP